MATVKKKTSLSARLREQQAKPAIEDSTPPPTPQLKRATPTKTAYKAPTRIGKRQLALYVDPQVLKQLKLIALDADISQQEILRQALNDYFEKIGKPRIA